MKLLLKILAALVGLAVVLFVAHTGTRWWIIHHTEPVRRGANNGWAEQDVVAKLGPPTQDLDYPVSLGPPPRNPSKEPCRTLVYRQQDPLRLESGTVYIWLRMQDGEWVCSASAWVRDGVMF